MPEPFSAHEIHDTGPARSAGTDPLALARDGWAAIQRHRFRAGQVFVGIVGASVVAALLLPNKYESDAKLMVKIGRESVTLDPTATSAAGQTLSIYDSRETEVNTILEILGSRAVLEDVVAELGTNVVLQDAAGDPLDPRRIESAVKSLEETTSVVRGKKSNVVSVNARSYAPEVAQQITQAMLNAFRGRYLMAIRTAGSYEFFVEQERQVAERLAAAMSELNTTRNDLAVGSIDAERAKIEGQISAVESERLTNAASLAAAGARIASLEHALGTLPERRVSLEVTGFAEDAAGRTRQQLYALKLEQHDLLTRYQASHPDVEALRERISRAESTLRTASARTTQTTTAVDPARQQLELALLTERANAESLRGGAAELDEQHTAIVSRLRKINEAEVRLTRLVQNVDRLRADHRDYSAKLEQARIDLALADDRISNVNVWQQPSLVAKPVASKRRLIVLFGLFVGTLSALGVAFGLEFLARQRRPPRSTTPPVVPERETGPLRRELAAAMNR